MRPFFVVILSCLLVGVVSSCSGDSHSKFRDIEIVKELPVFTFEAPSDPVGNMFPPYLINSLEELNDLYATYGLPRNEQVSSIDFSQYTVILVFERTVFQKVVIENAFVSVDKGSSVQQAYRYTITFHESNMLPEGERGYFYTGIVVNKLPDNITLNLVRAFNN